MDDPVEFLRTTLDAAQAKAEAASEGGDGVWLQPYPDMSPGMVTDSTGEYVVYDSSLPSLEQAAHIAANDPAAVLRRIAADREILEDAENIIRGWNEDHVKDFAQDVIRNLAEGWGWTLSA